MGDRYYSATEERVHAASHGIGMIFGIAALVWMLQVSIDASDPWRIAASTVYGISLILLFGSSMIYHGFHESPKKHVFKLLDHCAIYLLIAGTGTPFLLVALQTNIRWWLFGALWSLATLGILSKLWVGHRHPRLSLAGYLLMGWLMIIVVPQLIDAIGVKGMTWVVAGGVLYTVGAVFYMAKRLYFHHVIWHLFVLGGAACHFWAVISYVLPVQASAVSVG
jgi:hemolysin III